MMSIIQTFKERGFFQQTSHEDALEKRLQEGPICCYTGFDPTANSFHVGHLIPMMGLAHMQRAGHQVIALIGAGTAMIGDPSGKTEMRKILTKEQIEANIEGLQSQLARFLDFEKNAMLANNADWLCELNYIDFLRDIGRHFSVNRMLSFETYKARMETGLSFLEFNYQPLQAYDFLELYRRYGCLLQLGGDDQWANILSGSDLIRRVERTEAYALTHPLLTTSSGKKMGKTEKGAVWLDAEKTSPYEYYQYWVNIEDADVKKCLAIFTFLPMNEVEMLGDLQGADIREAKKRLAFETTKLLHGEQEALKAQEGASALFGGDSSRSENVPTSSISAAALAEGIEVFAVFQQTGLCKSKGEARRLLDQGGVYVNEVRILDDQFKLSPDDLDQGSVLLRAGKKRYHRLQVE
ncbi:MAG: tyrosine--tRNA ligase [SAR324 cluster bacterium]|nr:tyrosine--tRNA ligase [SAR324 cluster bacterium]